MIDRIAALEMADILEDAPAYDMGGYVVYGWSEYDGDPLDEAAALIRKLVSELNKWENT
jgi:hypothetical protein